MYSGFCPEGDKSRTGSKVVTLDKDMLTVITEPQLIIPGICYSKGTEFEGHAFFEASSMRKVGEKYYFVYSSWQNHELCYGVSDKPDEGFEFGGTIVSNGDIGLNGRKEHDRLNMTGTTHGSIVLVKGQWYVFFHRLTHKSDYSRQSCAEPIYIDENGHIAQVPVTSCGLNGGPLVAEGRYPAPIACNLTNGKMPHGSNSVYDTIFPNVSNIGDERFIEAIEHGTLIGYKYFDLTKSIRLGVVVRLEDESNTPHFDGPIRLDERCVDDGIPKTDYAKDKPTDKCFFEVRLSEFGESVGYIPLDGMTNKWQEFEGALDTQEGVSPLYLVYHGNKKIEFKELFFEKD